MTMQLGVFAFATEYSMPVGDLAEAAEARGFESLWLPEHTHIPAGRRTPYPGGGELPREYAHTLDPFVALAIAAARTERLRLGTGVCLLIERDTLTTAKAVATLDQASGGRFELGVGGGWNREEMEHHGTVYASRFRKLREQVEALQQIWTRDEAEYHGKFVDFGPVWSWPKPVQRPHPPILFGGESTHTLRRVLELGAGWLPRARNPERVLAGISELRALAKRAGRPAASVPISVFAPPPDPAWLERFAEADAERAVLWLPAEPPDPTLRRLDRYAELRRG
jgi:probable F420-dependent oxidoreductase